MSTSGSYTPPSAPPCAYAPAMTRAAALALRAAGTLNPNCVVVITDGPVIGTAGNTSPTQIELNPVSATDLGMSARVHTTFSASAWSGIYNIDVGAVGSIQRLTDDWNNTAQDANADSPTVHDQVPWHKGSATFRDNLFDSATLTAWDVAGGTIRDNVIQESTVNLTGKTAGTFDQNQMVGCTFSALTATSFIAGNQLTQAVVTHVGAGAGSFSLQNNVMLTGSLTVDAGTTAQVTVNNNVFGGTAGGYRVQVQGKTVGVAIISGNRLFNSGGAVYDLRVGGAADISVISNEISAGTITLNGSAPALVDSSNLSSSTVTQAGSGPLSVTASYLTAATAATAAPSARGLTVNQSTVASSIVTQNGTGSVNVDTLSQSQLFGGAVVNLNSVVGATPSQTFTRVSLSGGSTLNAVDPGTATPVTGSTIQQGSTLNLQAGGSLTNCRFGSGCTVNTAAFAHTGSVFEAFATKTSAGVNTGRLVNKSFDDWI